MNRDRSEKLSNSKASVFHSGSRTGGKGGIPDRLFKTAVFSVSFLLALAAFANAEPGMETRQNLDYRLLSLEDCVFLARRHNPQLGGAVEKIRELTAEYHAAKSQFLPQVFSSVYYQRLDANRLPPGGTTALPSMDFNREEAFAGVTGTQLLFDGGRTYYSTKAAKIGLEAQRQEVLRTGDQVAFDVTQAFYRLIEAKGNLKVAEDALKERKDFAAVTEGFFKAGKATKLDFFMAKAQVSDAGQAKIEAENAKRLAREILTKTIGLSGQIEVDIRGRLSKEYALSPDVETLWEEAVKNNPEIKRLNLEIEQTRTLVNVAKRDYYPEVNLQGDIGARHQDTAGTRGEWLAGIFARIPLFEGGLRRAQVAAADSRHLQSLDRKRERLNNLKIDLTRAWQDLKNARNGIINTRQTVAADKEAYTSAQSLYRNGKATALDVLQAEVDLTISRFNFVRYKTAFEIAKARVRQIVASPVFEQSRKSENGGRAK
jgi:outer membrane protein